MKEAKYLIVDIGTSSIRASILNDRLVIESSETVKRIADIIFDAEQEWRLIKAMIARLPERNRINGIAVSSLLGWVGTDRSGNAVTPCYSYMHQCMEQFNKFAGKYSDADVYPVSGRRMAPEAGVFKINYLQEEKPDQYDKLFCFFSLKDFINLKLTGEFAIDRTFAGYTLIYDIKQGVWSPQLISMAGIDREILPGLIRPYERLGFIKKEISRDLGIPEKTPVAGGSSDGSVGILGAGGVKKDMAVSVMGTTDVTFAISDECRLEKSMSLIVNPHVIPDLWLIGGPTGMFGGTVGWLIHNVMDDKRDIGEMNQFIEKIPAGCEGLKFIPTLLGERTPFWNPEMRGTMVGIRPVHKAEHIGKAIMEANGFTLRRILELAGQSGVSIDKVISIGGGSKSGPWLQIRSDITKLPVFAAETTEATTVGSAMLAMIMTGVPVDRLPVVNISGNCRWNGATAKLYDGLYADYLRLISFADRFYDKTET